MEKKKRLRNSIFLIIIMHALKNDKNLLCVDKLKYKFEAIIHIILISLATVMPM